MNLLGKVSPPYVTPQTVSPVPEMFCDMEYSYHCRIPSKGEKQLTGRPALPWHLWWPHFPGSLPQGPPVLLHIQSHLVLGPELEDASTPQLLNSLVKPLAFYEQPKLSGNWPSQPSDVHPQPLQTALQYQRETQRVIRYSLRSWLPPHSSPVSHYKL